MSGSSTSGGGVTPPYPSPSLQAIDQSVEQRRASASPTSDMEDNNKGRDTHHHHNSNSSNRERGGGGGGGRLAEAGTSNYYAGGNSRSSLSNAASPLLPTVVHNSDYMYAMDARDNMQALSHSNSLSSVAFEDSQKRSYHPIEFMMMAAGASAGNLAESLESGRLLRHTSESSPTSALGIASLGHLSTGQNSFVAAPDAQQATSPLLPRPITYGLGPLENPNNDTKLFEHVSASADVAAPAPRATPPSSTSSSHGKTPSHKSAGGVMATPPAATTASGAGAPPPPPPPPAAAPVSPTALSDSLPSIHGSVFSDAPKQLLPQIRSKNSMASTITTVDKSPLEPSMTARGATPNRSAAPSLNMSRFPIAPSPNSSVDTHRPTTPTPFSELPRGADGARGSSAFPTQRLPNPPERPPSHLRLDVGLADSRRSTNEVAGVRSSVRSTPTVAMLSNPPSPVKTTAYQTPLALLAESDDHDGGRVSDEGSAGEDAGEADVVQSSSSTLSAIVATVPSPSPPSSSSPSVVEAPKAAESSRGTEQKDVKSESQLNATLKTVDAPRPATLPGLVPGLPAPLSPPPSTQPPSVPDPAAPQGITEAPPHHRVGNNNNSKDNNTDSVPSPPTNLLALLPPPPSSSSSASSSSSTTSGTANKFGDEGKGKVSLSATPPPPPFGSDASPTSSGHLTRFAPLIQQTDYHKSDIKDIACTGAFTMGDVSKTAVKLRLLRHELLGRAEPIPSIQAAAINAGRVKWRKAAASAMTASGSKTRTGEAAKESEVPADLPRPVSVHDFHDTLVVFDNVLLAICFALWGSVAHYNELVRGLLSYCAADVVKSKSVDKKEDGTEEGKKGDGKGASTVRTSSEVPPSSAMTKSRLNVPFSSVLRFLNHCGVDVLVLTANRKAASSFCAKRQQVRRRVRRDSDACRERRSDAAVSVKEAAAGELSTTQQQQQQPQDNQEAAPQTLATPPPSEALRRVCVALSYDDKQHVWCPLTTSRPMRDIAAAWHEERRRARQRARRTERRERRRKDVEAAAAEEKAAVQAKLRAWQQRMHAFCQVEASPAVGAAAVPTPSTTLTGGLTSADAAAATASPQQAPVAVVVVPQAADTATDESGSPAMKPGNKLPFDGIYYPNLVQTDVGFGVMLKQGMHPLFGLARLRLMIGLPLGIVTFFFGLALIIYVTKTTAVCFFDITTQQCVALITNVLDSVSGATDAASSSSSSSSGAGGSSGESCFAILAGSALDGFNSRLSLRFLYGQPVSPGNCLIVTLCCTFAATLATALGVYFVTRHLALGSVRPCFHFVLQGVQLVFGAVTCAFAAYVLFCFHARRHTMQCAALKDADATLCHARLRNCGARYAYEAHTRLSGPNVPLALAVVYLVLCVLHWLSALLPVAPSPQQQDAIPTATPDTYAFRPSYFAPDGPTPREIQQLREVMQAPLRNDLAQCVQQQDRLLTASTTIGEMMQANRMQSLKQMKLNEQGRLRRTRPFSGPRDGKGGGRGRRGATRARRHRYLVYSDDDDDQDGLRSGSESGSSTSQISATAAAATRDRRVVLAPRLVQRVDAIGVKVRARAAREKRSSNPFLTAAVPPASAQSSTTTTTTPPLQKSNVPAPSPSASPFSSFRRTPSNLRKVVVVADTKDRHSDDGKSNDDDSASSRRSDGPTAAGPSASLTAENTLPMYAATFAPISPEKLSTSRQQPSPRPSSSSHVSAPRPAASALASKSSFARFSGSEGRPKTSLQSHHRSQPALPLSGNYGPRSNVVSPAVEYEIDHIVSRLRGTP